MTEQERLIPERLEELRRVAEAATPGPWELDIRRYRFRIRMGSAVPYTDDYEQQHLIEWDPGVYYAPGYPETDVRNRRYLEAEANARYIATFDPPTVLALLDEIGRLRNAATDPGEDDVDEPAVDWKRTAELRAQVIERLRRGWEKLEEAVRAMKYFFDSDYSDPEESATLNWSYAHQKWLEALALLDGEKGGGGA